MIMPIEREILLIDDNAIDLFLNERVLRLAGFEGEILPFHSSFGASNYLSKLKNTSIKKEIIIVLDLYMPSEDGFEFIENNLQLITDLKIRIFVLSCSLHPEDRSRCASYPVIADFFEKPLLVDHILGSPLFEGKKENLTGTMQKSAEPDHYSASILNDSVQAKVSHHSHI
jgi:response regulator RpfG family c-di-GMP phosphodiesterase